MVMGTWKWMEGGIDRCMGAGRRCLTCGGGRHVPFFLLNICL